MDIAIKKQKSFYNHSPTNEKTGKMTTKETVAFKGSDSSTALFHSEQKENLQGGKNATAISGRI